MERKDGSHVAAIGAGVPATERKNIFSLQRQLESEKDGGVADKDHAQRKDTWKEILSLSFGNGNIPHDVDLDAQPYTKDQLKEFGHVLVSGVAKAGQINIGGKLWGPFDRIRKSRPFVAEIVDGLPRRVFFLDNCTYREFLPITDN
jgi:hypothetical protein